MSCAHACRNVDFPRHGACSPLQSEIGEPDENTLDRFAAGIFRWMCAGPERATADSTAAHRCDARRFRNQSLREFLSVRVLQTQLSKSDSSDQMMWESRNFVGVESRDPAVDSGEERSPQREAHIERAEIGDFYASCMNQASAKANDCLPSNRCWGALNLCATRAKSPVLR